MPIKRIETPAWREERERDGNREDERRCNWREEERLVRRLMIENHWRRLACPPSAMCAAMQCISTKKFHMNIATRQTKGF